MDKRWCLCHCWHILTGGNVVVAIWRRRRTVAGRTVAGTPETSTNGQRRSLNRWSTRLLLIYSYLLKLKVWQKISKFGSSTLYYHCTTMGKCYKTFYSCILLVKIIKLLGKTLSNACSKILVRLYICYKTFTFIIYL